MVKIIDIFNKKKELNNKRLVFVGLGVLLLLVVILLITNIFNSNKSKELTDLEKIKIEETSKDAMLFMEEIDTMESKEIDRYISYALEYSYNINNKDSLSAKEIKDLVESKFNIKLKEKDIASIGITPFLLDRNISHDSENESYKIDKSGLTQPIIAKIPIVSYEIKDIKKEKDKFIITYDKYLVENPYEVLNYYNDLKDNKYDTKDIYGYLTTKGKIISVKKAINKKNINKVGKIVKELKVTYILKNNMLLIDKL